MEFLSNLGISNRTIESLKNNCSKEELSDIVECSNRVKSSILLLRGFGVTNSTIEDILVMDYHKLMPGGQHLIKAFQRVSNLSEFVNNLNRDVVTYMDYLDNIF